MNEYRLLLIKSLSFLSKALYVSLIDILLSVIFKIYLNNGSILFPDSK